MSHYTTRLWCFRGAAMLLLAVLVSGFVPPASHAQVNVRYFPETGHFLGGVFRNFWEANGGVPVFGYPITEEYIPGSTGRITQYFERARFELIEQNGQYTVQLGNLGVEVTEGRIFPKVPPIINTADRRYVPETEHIVQYGFKTIWERYGEARYFGYPISEEIQERFDDGRWRTVQYFERARFEYHPERAPGDRVLITHLGRWLAPPQLTPPLPANAPPAGPIVLGESPSSPQQQRIPPSINATVTPSSGPPGTTFAFAAFGFNPGERVGIWLTAPDQSTFDAGFQADANDDGSIVDEGIALETDESFPGGIWSFNARGVNSGVEAVGYFLITRDGAAPGPVSPPPGDATRLGVIVHDELPTQGDAFILPVAAPSGAGFEFVAGGYTPGEQVNSWYTDAGGNSTPIESDFTSLDDNGIFSAIVFSTGFPNNSTYTVVGEGASSGVVNAAALRVTNNYVAGPGTPRPTNTNGTVSPAEGGAGTIFSVRGQNLQPGEALEFWITEPTGFYILLPFDAAADGQGRIGYDPVLDLNVDNSFAPGVYGFHFRGRSSGARVSVYFTVVGTSGSGMQTPLTSTMFAADHGLLPQLTDWQR